jgi:pyruvate,water dikinase
MVKPEDIWEHYWVAEQPIFKHYAQTQALIKCRNIIGNTAHRLLIHSKNGVAHLYYTQKSYKKIQIDGRKLLNFKIAQKTTKDIRNAVKNFWENSKQLRALLLKKESLHSHKFINLFKNFDTLVIKIFSYFRTTWEATSFYSEEELKKVLKINYGNDWEEKFITLITASEADLLLKEKISWIKVLKNPTKEKVSQHMLDFPFLFCNIESEKDAFKIMLKRSKTDSITDLGEEVIISEKRLQKIKSVQNEFFLKINSKKAKNIASLLQSFSLLRLELKNCWQGIHFYLFPLFDRIAQQTNLNVKDIMMFWSLEDIRNFLENKIALSKSEVQNRRYFYLLLLNKGRFNFYSGKIAEKMKKEILDKFLPKEIKEFKGSVANRGKVRGKVKIIKFDDLRVIEKVAKIIKEKFILVTGMTNPNMVPLIKKAKGIVTDEGGMTCHAAIISREFNVPCIVGTRIATSILKDGDLVEVDANKGIIKRI